MIAYTIHLFLVALGCVIMVTSLSEWQYWAISWCMVGCYVCGFVLGWESK